MTEPENRRPLKVRSLKTAQGIAAYLAKRNVTPNQISIASVFFALLAATCLLWYSQASGMLLWLLPWMAALFIQCRLLCNLFDGMVAVEGAKGTPSGELFNDIPDRIADPLILIAAGYAVPQIEIASHLGWAAGLLAVMTAYLRTLASSMGAPANFSGPMAKQHRMALMTGVLLLTPFEGVIAPPGSLIVLGLGLVIVGAVITCIRRTRHAYRHLEQHREH